MTSIPDTQYPGRSECTEYYSLPALLESVRRPSECQEQCQARGHRFAGVLKGRHCHCGDHPPPDHLRLAEAECDTACEGDQAIPCGGKLAFNLYSMDAGAGGIF